MKHLKLLENNESYDTWIKSDNAGFPNITVLDFSNENYSPDNSIIFTESAPIETLPCPIPEEGLEIYETASCPSGLLETNTQNGIALFNYFASLCPNDGDTYILPDNELVVVTYDSNPSPYGVRLVTEKISNVSRFIYSGTGATGQPIIINNIQCYLVPYTYVVPGEIAFQAVITHDGCITIESILS